MIVGPTLSFRVLGFDLFGCFDLRLFSMFCWALVFALIWVRFDLFCFLCACYLCCLFMCLWVTVIPGLNCVVWGCFAGV